MHALLVSIGVVALSEIGDKTQLLALVLASRFKQPVPIILGMLTATILNHAWRRWPGRGWRTRCRPVLRWGLVLCFLAMAVWALIPDTLDEAASPPPPPAAPSSPPLCAFFIAEIGDKTQLATAALAAKFEPCCRSSLGTTLGMMLADVPAVLIGHAAGHRIQLKWVRWLAAAVSAALAVATLLGPRLP